MGLCVHNIKDRVQTLANCHCAACCLLWEVTSRLRCYTREGSENCKIECSTRIACQQRRSGLHVSNFHSTSQRRFLKECLQAGGDNLISIHNEHKLTSAQLPHDQRTTSTHSATTSTQQLLNTAPPAHG